MRRFRIGEIVLCKCPDGFLEPGEIVETVTKNGRTEIVVRFPDDEKNMEVRNNPAGRYCYCIFRTKTMSGKSDIMGTTAYGRDKRCLWKRHERIRVGDL